MENNMISVIVPIYNIENYIEKTINSIINQTYQNLEIILVDDGSTDDSGKIIDDIAKKDSRLLVIHKKNGGVTSARASGIKAATGDWIGFVDGDDYIEPDMYERLMNNAIKYDAHISHCGYQMVFPSRVDYYYNTKRIVVQDNEQGLSDLLRGEFIEPALVNKIYRSEIVKKVLNNNLIDYSIKINEDLLMNYYFFKFSSCSIYEDVCSYHYVLRSGSAATSEINKYKLYDPLIVQKTILQDVGDNSKLADIVYGRLASIYINGASMRENNKMPFVNEYIKECRTELRKLKPLFFRSGRTKYDVFKYNLCSISPAMYRLFHKLYSKIRGTDKKYEVK